MPRGKKKTQDEEVDDDIIEDAEEEETPKPKKKSGSKRAAPKKKKAAKKVASDTEEEDDELSDLEVGETDENAQDEAFTSRPHQKTPRKVIDPETPIGEVKTDDILSYLIQRGADSLNPQLKQGALDLLHRLTGRRRRPPMRNNQGNNQGNFGRPPFQNGGNGGPNFSPRWSTI